MRRLAGSLAGGELLENRAAWVVVPAGSKDQPIVIARVRATFMQSSRQAFAKRRGPDLKGDLSDPERQHGIERGQRLNKAQARRPCLAPKPRSARISPGGTRPPADR